MSTHHKIESIIVWLQQLRNYKGELHLLPNDVDKIIKMLYCAKDELCGMTVNVEIEEKNCGKES